MNDDIIAEPVDSGAHDPAAAAQVQAALEARLAALEATMRERLVRAELKAHALRAGMVDLDGLKLLDTSGVTLNERDEVVGAEPLMAEMRRAKPWLLDRKSVV